jgi:hypothetical protein
MLDTDDIIEQIQILHDYKVNKNAGLNVLYAVLTHVFAFKNVRFESINNINSPAYLAYYAFNFIGSGGIKNVLLKDIRNKLVPFFESEVNSFNATRKKEMELKYTKELGILEDAPKSEFNAKTKEQNEALNNFRNLEYSVGRGSTPSVYMSLDIIKKENKGSIFIENTEFMDDFESAFFGNDILMKQFLSCLNNFYDGEFIPTNTVSTQREIVRGFSTSLVHLSDPSALLENGRTSKQFKKELKSGWARRSFIYYKKDESFYNDNVRFTSAEEKDVAIEKLKEYSKIISNIYFSIPDLMVYKFTPSANNVVIEWKKQICERIKSLYKYTKRLDKDYKILEVNLEGSTWKIIKLAVLLHIIENPTKKDIGSEPFKKACDFFNIMHKSLEDLLLDRTSSDYDDMYSYLLKNINKFVSKTDLNRQQFVKPREFSKWISNAVSEMENLCEGTGLEFCSTVTGQRNTGVSYALYDPKLYKFVCKDTDGIIKGDLISVDKLVANEVGEEALLD